MNAIGPNVFLPRVTNCPRVVMVSAVGRGLRGLYADVLEEPLPDNFTAMIWRIVAGSRPDS